ncbi:MAG: hypothetical protein JSV84_05365 [Gemmatimonadota bacterium]|nr:MAG: hypothetical protein JSV84_05365 [Gemmatimonadota bacterium]
MIDCKRAQDSMSDFIEGLLETEKHNIVQTHVDGCSLCASVCERMRRVRDLLNGLPQVASSPTFEHILKDKLRLERERSEGTLWRRLPSYLPIRPRPAFAFSMACLAVVIGLFLVKSTLLQKRQPLFIAESEHSTKVERISPSEDTVSLGSPARLVSDRNEAPNYVLRKISPQHLELQRGYLSSTWQSQFNREYILGQTRLQWTSEGLQAVKYVLPSATPPRRLQTVTFSP